MRHPCLHRLELRSRASMNEGFCELVFSAARRRLFPHLSQYPLFPLLVCMKTEQSDSQPRKCPSLLSHHGTWAPGI